MSLTPLYAVRRWKSVHQSGIPLVLSFPSNPSPALDLAAQVPEVVGKLANKPH